MTSKSQPQKPWYHSYSFPAPSKYGRRAGNLAITWTRLVFYRTHWSVGSRALEIFQIGYCLLTSNRSSQQETRSELENIKNMLSTFIVTMKRTPEISPAQLSSFLTSAQPVCHCSAQSMHPLPQQLITPHNGPVQPMKTSYESIGGRSAKSECEVPTSIDCVVLQKKRK
jgi:hypothetical protein